MANTNTLIHRVQEIENLQHIKIVDTWMAPDKLKLKQDIKLINNSVLKSQITGCTSEGQYLIIFFDNGRVLVLKMGEAENCGIFKLNSPTKKDNLSLVFKFHDGKVLSFETLDSMTAFVRTKQNWNLLEPISLLGDNIYSTNADTVYKVLHENKAPIFHLLVGGKVISDLSLKIVNELLWINKLNPNALATSLKKSDWINIISGAIMATDGNLYLKSGVVNKDKLKKIDSTSPTEDRVGQECLRKKCDGKIILETIASNESLHCDKCQL